MRDSGHHTMTGDLRSMAGVSLAAAAHDLKSPLATIQYLGALLQDKTVEMSPAERERYILRMQLAARQGLQLVESMAFAFHTDQVELPLEPINVRQVCEETLHSLLPAARHQGQAFDIRMAPQLPLVLAHQGALRSVVTNLCDNAIKHNPVGSAISLRAGRVGDGTVVVSVRDNGPVMKAADFRRLKSRLGRQVQPLGSHRVGGSGLGLYIAAQLSEAMQGSLQMTRHHDSGVTFRLSLQPSRQLSLLDLS